MSSNDKNSELHDCIYGGPLPVEQLVSRLAEAGIDFPVLTTVIRESDSEPNWESWDFRPGDGWVYRTLPYRPAMGETHRRAGSPREWQRSLQDRLIELRLAHVPGNAHLHDPQQEARARQLALFQFNHSLPNWRDALTCWEEAVLLRTQTKIHDTHRAYLGFLLEAATPLPTIGLAGHRFHNTMQQMLSTFTLDGLGECLRHGLEIVQEQLVQQNRRLDTTIRKALEYVHRNLTEPISINDLAESVGMTPAAFSRKFKIAMNQTFTVYLQSMRIERAIPLLLGTNRTVLEVALDSGFGSVEQFHRVFKSRFGVTPLNYRLGKSRENKTLPSARSP